MYSPTLCYPSPILIICHSEGCANAVKRILGKIEGVSSIETDVASKSVVVQADASVTPEFMLEKLEKVRRMTYGGSC